MPTPVFLLSVPGLREKDLVHMPNLTRLVAGGERAPLVPSFPAVTCPVQANLTTGLRADQHGVVANGFYWRDRQEVEMWTAWNECIQRPQIWDRLHDYDAALTSAVWFPMLCKGCGADTVCTPAPIHNPDGSESLWCYTRPEQLYGDLRDALDHFPLHHFWGPLANIKATQWILDSAILAVQRFRPSFVYIYVPHLDIPMQKDGPDGESARTSLMELDQALGTLIAGCEQAYERADSIWIVASEYAIVAVNHVLYPNRILRNAGLLSVRVDNGREELDLERSQAWALVDHQFSHVFVKDSRRQVIRRVVELFEGQGGVSEVLSGEEKHRYHLGHSRSGDVILVSSPHSWQAYYWWEDDNLAPPFARQVDIHRKPGYDPVEMYFDPATRGIPLDAALVKGSHGAPAMDARQWGVVLTSRENVLPATSPAQGRLGDTDVAEMVLRLFGAA